MQFCTFIIIFGVIVLVHEVWSLFAIRILVREFSIGIGQMLYILIRSNNYTIRILRPRYLYFVWLAGVDTTEIKTGTPVSAK